MRQPQFLLDVLICLLILGGFSAVAFSQSPPPISLDISISLNVPFPNGDLDLAGFASPNAFVTVKIDGAVAGTTTAAANSSWGKIISGLTPEDHSVEIYQVDTAGRQSASHSFTIAIASSSTTTVSNIFLPTTIALETTSVPRPASKLALGATKPAAILTLFVFSHGGDVQAISVPANGGWSGNVNRKILHLGSHTVYAIVQDSSGLTTPSSKVVPFTVILSADLNQDGRVDPADFAIFLESFERQPVPNLAADINDEGKADLVDFSVMLFYWTG